MIAAEIDLLGIAAVFTASAVLITALAGAVVQLRSVRTLHRVDERTIETHELVTHVDAAVNGKEPGEPALAEQVRDLHDRLPVPKSETIQGVIPLLREVVERLERIESTAPTDGFPI